MSDFGICWPLHYIFSSMTHNDEKRLVTLVRHVLYGLLTNYWSSTFAFITEIYFWKMSSLNL